MIQLNRRFGFLQQSQVCVDLCAAPGGWMQVAKQNMPISSIVIGVDLYPIKPIPGCIALIEDITTDKCKTSLSRELKTWKVDVVLHDGAPNVGKNWLFDAYQQVCLTLNALKLASGFLRSGGWFITKVFRSKDYNALLWVLKQLFKKVHATKPSASRKESAEIFVVCQHYLAPDKIDPKFFDSKYVFEELDLENPKQFSLLQQNDKKRIKAVGYTEKEFSMRSELDVSDFIAAENGLNELQGVSEIVFDSDVIKNHPKTTEEIKECCKDIKVLSRKDIRNLLAWWKVLHEQMYPKEKIAAVSEEEAPKKPLSKEEEDDLEVDEMENHIAEMELEDMKEAKRKKKKTAKTRSKLNEKLNLKMVLKYDEGPREEADDMFDMSGVNQADLDALDDQDPNVVLDSDTEVDSFKPKFKRYNKDDKIYLDDNGRYEDTNNYDDESDEDLEMESDLEVSKGLGLNDSDEDVKVPKKKKTKNPLINDLDFRDKDSKRRQRVQLWFDKDTIKEAEKDENEDLDLDTLAAEYKSKGVNVLGAEERNQQPKIEMPLGKKARRRARHEDAKKESSSEESSDEEEPKESVPKKPVIKLSSEELALGALMVSSRKTKRDLIDEAYNRYAFNDENLPDWFVQDEKLHMRTEIPVPKELVAEYTKRLEEFNVRPIKKVMEAKARKKRRTMKRLEKAKKKAENILENTDASSQEKIRQLKKLYRKAEDKKKLEVTYVVARKSMASKRVKRPAGVKGRFKVVDPRLKKDTRAKKVIQKRMKKKK